MPADGTGWTRLDGFLSTAEVEATLAVCDELLQLPAGERLARDKPAAGTRHLADLDTRSKLIDEFLTRAPLVECVTAILGPSFERSEVAYRSPQPSFGGQKLHADDPPMMAAGPATVATAIVALTAFTNDNGATRLIPGSHGRPDLQRHSGQLDEHPDEIRLTGEPGTAFVFSGHLLHSGTTNRSTAARPALHLVWRTRPRGQ